VRFFDFGQEATGVIAIGQIATGVVAIGQFATGVIAIGQVSRGLIAVGQLSVGLAAAGQLGVGIVYGAGMLGLGTFARGLVPISFLGPVRPWKIIVMIGVFAIVAFAALIPLWRALFGLNGIFYVPPPRR